MFQKYRTLVAAAVAIGATGVGFTFWRASRTLDDIETRAAKDNQYTFRSARIEKAQQNGIEYLNTPLSYTDVASFGGKLYVAGPTGLFVFSAAGVPEASYRVGIDLPPAPITAIAVANVPSPELWLATAGEGLVAFDGTVFRHVRPDAVEHRTVNAILPLSTGRLLVGTAKAGLLSFDGSNLRQFHESTTKLSITTLAGTEQDLWVGTIDRGLLHWHAGQLDRFTESDGLPDKQVLALAVHGDTAYAGTATGIAEFHNGRFSRKLADGIFAKALHATEDKLYAGTLEEGVYELQRTAQRPRPVQFSGDTPPGAVQRITTLDGITYALTSDALYETGKAWKSVIRRPESALTDRNISALSVEDGGRLWVGYFDRGLDVVESSSGKPHIKKTKTSFALIALCRISHEI